MFEKLKSFFKKGNTDSAVQTDAAGDTTPIKNDTTEQPTKAHLTNHPITSDIMAWLDKQNWHYEHRLPDDEGRTHHLIMGFSDQEHDWTCVFRINEENQLVVVFGVLDESVPVSHYTAMLMELSKVNMSISFGHIEFDPMDGEVRVKIAFDVEFNVLSDKSLGCYLQAVAGLTEVARGIMTLVLSDDKPSQFAGDYIDMGDEIKAVVDDEKRVFFLPTHTPQ